MSSDINVVVLSGCLVKEPELKFTPKGTAITSLRLASNRYWHDPAAAEGEFKKQSLFITADMFGKLAERVAAQKKKGDPIMVWGRLVFNEWTTTDGQKRQVVKMIGDDVKFLPAKRQDKSGDASAKALDAEADLDEVDELMQH